MLQWSIVTILLIISNRWHSVTVDGFLFTPKFQIFLNHLRQNPANHQFVVSWDFNNNYNSLNNAGVSYATNQYGLNPALLEYDFVIVGSGPAGCVLANRLSENPNWKILLLEAGKPETFAHFIPSIAAYFQSTESNWNYLAERSDRFCLGMEGKKCALPRGKALGGSSVLNYMIYNRGNPRDFDGWAALGNEGWSYREVLPYFLKSERANLRGKENSPFHNRYGSLSVEDVPWRSRIVRAFVKGSKQAGHRETDYNSDQQMGVSFVQANTFKGRRHSAATAFIDPIAYNRPNLHILLEARVTKVLIDPATKKAYGVEYMKNKRKYQVTALKEVILSAGAFNSPQLLMLSGIGPQEQLKRVNIPVMQHLPGVGQNMYDHMSHFGPTFVVNTTGESLSVNRIDILEMKKYLVGQGFLTSIGGVEALNFIKTKNTRDPPDFPDAELIFVSGSLASDQGTGLRKGMRISQEIYDTVFRPLDNPNIDHWSVLVMGFHPRSRGYMELKDNNPFHWPRIFPNYFEDPDDVETLLEGIKEAVRISKTPAMQKLGTRLHDIPLPQCRHLHFGSDDYWRCSIRTLSCTLHHQVNSCRMAPASDPMAVVDSKLRVHGIKRLRVADCSIVPAPITAHTNAVSFMIGEKLADMLKAKWNRQQQ